MARRRPTPAPVRPLAASTRRRCAQSHPRPPRITMRRGILFGFVLTLAVLVGNAVFAVVNTRVLIETGRWVFHTHDVLRQIDAIQSTLVDADAGERGYLLTGDDAYLVPYRT